MFQVNRCTIDFYDRSKYMDLQSCPVLSGFIKKGLAAVYDAYHQLLASQFLRA